MKITTDLLDKLFNFLNKVGKMILYFYQLFRGKL